MHVLLGFAATYADSGTTQQVSTFRFGSPAVTAACSSPTYLANPFALDEGSGNLTLADYGSLKPSFDVESCQSFVIKVSVVLVVVEAEGGGGGGKKKKKERAHVTSHTKVIGAGTSTIESTCSVTITVRNMNDSPYFSPTPDNNNYITPISVMERSARNTKVGGESYALDKDDGQSLEYSIISGNDDGNGNEMFWIKKCSGQIYVNKDMVTNGIELNAAAKSKYDLEIRVKDDANLFGFSQAASITSRLEINVLDVNDPPVIVQGVSPPSCDIQGTTYDNCFTVTENVAVGTTLSPATITASDPDNNVLVYSIDSSFGDHDKFTIVSSTGEIKTAVTLNYEAQQKYLIKVVVTESGTAEQYSRKAVYTVKVADAVSVGTDPRW